jgi:hypothetical protein
MNIFNTRGQARKGNWAITGDNQQNNGVKKNKIHINYY